MEEQIVGKWRWETATYEFHRDGTYDYINTYSGVRNSGRYAVEGNILTFSVGSKSEISISGNSLYFTPVAPQRGTMVVFTRA